MNRLFALPVAAILLAIPLSTSAPAQEATGTSQADLPSYSGAFSIENPTTVTLSYEVRWGSNRPWKRITLLPGHTETHRYPLGSNPNASIPAPYIRFDHIAGDNRVEPKEYEMDFHSTGYAGYGPAANRNKPKEYFFKFSPDGKLLDVLGRKG